MSPARRWVAGIVGLLGANVLASAILATTAAHGASQVIPDYYEAAVHYDDAIARAAANARLGWTVAARVEGAEVVVAAPAGARVVISGYPRAHAERRFSVELAGGRGVLPAHGICDVELAVTRGAERFVERRTLEVP